MNHVNGLSLKIPRRGVKNFNKEDYSYANSVLNSLSCLDCIRELTNKEILGKIYQKNFYLAKDFFNLIFILNRIDNQEACSQEIIASFQKAYYRYKNLIKSQNVLKRDPYHFLFFLLQFLHIEINEPKVPNYKVHKLYNQKIQEQRNDDYMYQLYLNCYENTQNSLISYYFFNIERNAFNCLNCGTYYFYSYKNMLKINVDKARNFRDSHYPQYREQILNLDDILNFYFSPHSTQCKNCNQNANDEIKIVNNSKVLIIVLERNNHNNNFNGDIRFCLDINLNKYFFENNYNKNEKTEKNYSLKSCISLNEKYLSFCCLNIKNNKGWYKFIDDYVIGINGIEELYQFEPQILIYEINRDSNQDDNIFQNQSFNNNNFNRNDYNQFNINNIANNLSNNNLSNMMNNCNNGNYNSNININYQYNNGNNNNFNMENNSQFNNGNNNNNIFNVDNNNNQYNNGNNNTFNVDNNNNQYNNGNNNTFNVDNNNNQYNNGNNNNFNMSNNRKFNNRYNNLNANTNNVENNICNNSNEQDNINISSIANFQLNSNQDFICNQKNLATTFNNTIKNLLSILEED